MRYRENFVIGVVYFIYLFIIARLLSQNFAGKVLFFKIIIIIIIIIIITTTTTTFPPAPQSLCAPLPPPERRSGEARTTRY